MLINKFISYLAVVLVTLIYSVGIRAEMVNDFSRLNPIEVNSVIDVLSIQDILNAVNYAQNNNLKISISGKRHSQGGHTAKKDSLVLNMSRYNKVVKFSPDSKIIIVESGVTWAEIQAYINQYNLAVKVAQSSNIFSIGGSLSANIHGRDPRYGTVVETVISFKIVLSDGSHVKVSRDENKELFYSVIGGYGLLGVITEVELSLTENHCLKKTVVELPFSEYTKHLNNVLNDSLALHYGRCSIVKNKGFFRDCISVDYIQQENLASTIEIEPEKNISRDKYFFGLSRHYDWAKSLRWWLQGALIDSPGKEINISRNNAMSPPISFLEHYSKKDTDILQEYFVKKESLAEYLSELSEILLKYNVNVLSMTLRYVPESENVYLNYAEIDSISVVLYINIGMDVLGVEKARKWTTKLVDLINHFKGKYYLTYQSFPTKQQFQAIYPRWREFDQIKKKYDKYGMFTSEFYAQYF